MQNEYKHEGKVIFVGEANVGKTCLLNALLNRTFQDNLGSTVNPGFEILNTKDSDGNAKRIQLWDTSGQERYQSVASLFFREASLAVVCFESTDENSMQNSVSWINSVQQAAPTCRFIFVGTKQDLLVENQVNQVLSKADSFYEIYDPIQIIITSSKTGQNVKLLKKVLANSIAAQSEIQNELTVDINNNDNEAKKSGCC
ncbi:hypothetical protein M9Y10_041751 [Tritrichomonas musculus]|uniref:Small GTP-binding protein n=1 Tax=Tritrichomonas musculus TaxID=1915356 RepID=A0ABR2K596_9EUKA